MKSRVMALLILALALNDAFAQTENLNYHNVLAKFKDNYNDDKFDSIFTMYSDKMQQSFPLDKTVDFWTRLKSDAGHLGDMVFEKYQAPFGYYKLKFGQDLFSLKISIDEQLKIIGLLIKPYQPDTVTTATRNTTLLNLPFKGEWTVIWGGDTKEQNYHVESRAQKNAFDIVIKGANEKSYKTDGKTNEDYYAFGEEITAPCDGIVVLVVDGIKDNIPGHMNPMYAPGNSVIIKTANDEYLVFAHFKQHSIRVSQGQKVKKGTVLGLCGNSGNSSEPHLHFHLQNSEDLNTATGVKCFFQRIMVNGIIKTDYSPIRGDRIQRVTQ